MKLAKLGKVGSRKSFILGKSALVKKAPKGSLLGTANVKVKIFQGARGGVTIQMPEGAKIKMTKGKYMSKIPKLKK